MVEKVDVVIREAREGDLEALEWEGRYQHFRRLYRNAMNQARRGRRILLVAESEGMIVGQVFVQLVSSKGVYADGSSSGYLYAFRVRPEYRSQGIGGELLRAAEDELKARSFTRAVIAVAKTNDRARRLYEKFGFSKVGDDPGRWSYLDHEGKIRHVSEPAFILEKLL